MTNSSVNPSLHSHLLEYLNNSNSMTEELSDQMHSDSSITIGPYRIIKDLGEGSFSNVKLAIHQTDNTIAALKLIPLSKILTHEQDNKPSKLCYKLFMEIWIMSHLPNSSYFPKIHGLLLTNLYCVIVMEAITNGIELFEYLNKVGHISNEDDAKKVLHAIAESIFLLHSIGIVHRDLKLENLLLIPSTVNGSVNIKLVDFGLATWLPLENATEIISFELRREWNDQLMSFWELLFECGRIHSFLKQQDTLTVLYQYKDNNKKIPEDLLPNWTCLWKILFHPISLSGIYQSNAALYEQTLLMERCGSEEYAPPELLLQTTSPYSGQIAECWSLGIIFYAVLTGRFPFQYTSASAFRQTIAKGVIQWNDTFYPSSKAKTTVEKLLETSPFDRYRLPALINNPWFN